MSAPRFVAFSASDSLPRRDRPHDDPAGLCQNRVAGLEVRPRRHPHVNRRKPGGALRIEEHGVEVPDYVKITRALGGPIAITEEPAIRMAKEALS